jgi:DNA-binding CsgD family transcriptional regulator
MNEQQTQFPAHALPLAFCLGAVYNSGGSDAVAWPGDRALTMQERQVLGYAELGNSNKLIAYSLGLSTYTVAATLARARRKLETQS